MYHKTPTHEDDELNAVIEDAPLQREYRFVSLINLSGQAASGDSVNQPHGLANGSQMHVLTYEEIVGCQFQSICRSA